MPRGIVVEMDVRRAQWRRILGLPARTDIHWADVRTVDIKELSRHAKRTRGGQGDAKQIHRSIFVGTRPAQHRILAPQHYCGGFGGLLVTDRSLASYGAPRRASEEWQASPCLP